MSSRLAFAGGGEVLIAFLELQTQVDHGLLEGDDLLLQLVDIERCAKPGFAPRLLAEGFGEALLQLVNAAGQPAGAVVRVGKVGLQGRAGHGGPNGRVGRRVDGRGMELFEQVPVPVEEGPVDAGALGYAADAEVSRTVDRLVQDLDDALPAACGVGPAAFGHGGRGG